MDDGALFRRMRQFPSLQVLHGFDYGRFGLRHGNEDAFE
jgi:hypothetical protein